MVFSILYMLVRRLVRLGSSEQLIQGLLAENVALRQENVVLKRTNQRPKLRRLDKVLLAACSRILPRARWAIFSVKPSTLTRWHSELIRRKWTYKHKKAGRPPVNPELVKLICQMARKNPGWGYLRTKGECGKLGLRIGATTIKRILARAGISPAPRRLGPTWSEFLRAQAQGIMACDFFSVETVFLRTLYVLLFIEVSTRRVHFMASTQNPSGEFCTQQARNLYMIHEPEVRFLIRDRDSKYICSFDEVFRTQGARVIKTPFKAPKANCYAERLVGTVRREVLDHLLILGPRHLDLVLSAFAEHYNGERPHRGLDLGVPDHPEPVASVTEVPRIKIRGIFGGLINEYHAVAA